MSRALGSREMQTRCQRSKVVSPGNRNAGEDVETLEHSLAVRGGGGKQKCAATLENSLAVALKTKHAAGT